jgi:iron complex transport system substrate-binding protein
VRKTAIIALVLLLSGCSQTPIASTYTISQDDVRSISLSKDAQFTAARVVVLANGVAEIIQSLNAQSIIVGRDISSTEVSLDSIPIVTSGHQVLPEKVIALKPDLVLIDASTGPKAAIETIKAAGISVVQTPESWSLQDLPIKVRAVGRAIGAPKPSRRIGCADRAILKWFYG